MPRLYKIALALGILAAPAAAFAHPHTADPVDATAAAAAAAEPARSTQRAARREARLDKLFAKLDVDHDGSISRAELGAMKQMKRLKMKQHEPRKKMLKAKRAKHLRHAHRRALGGRR